MPACDETVRCPLCHEPAVISTTQGLQGFVCAAVPAGAAIVPCQGTTSGKVLRLKGRGFTARDGKRGDQLVTLDVDLPADDAALRQFAEGWDGGGNPRAPFGV